MSMPRKQNDTVEKSSAPLKKRPIRCFPDAEYANGVQIGAARGSPCVGEGIINELHPTKQNDEVKKSNSPPKKRPLQCFPDTSMNLTRKNNDEMETSNGLLKKRPLRWFPNAEYAISVQKVAARGLYCVDEGTIKDVDPAKQDGEVKKSRLTVHYMTKKQLHAAVQSSLLDCQPRASELECRVKEQAKKISELNKILRRTQKMRDDEMEEADTTRRMALLQKDIRIKALEKQLTKSEASLDQLILGKSKLDTDYEALKAEMEALKDGNHASHSQITLLNKQNKELQQAAEGHVAQLASMNEMKNTMQRELELNNAEMVTLKEEAQQVKEKCKDLEGAVRQKIQEEQSLKEEVRKFKIEVVSIKQQQEIMVRINSHSCGLLETLRQEAKRHKEQLTSMNEAVNTLQTDLKQKNTEVEALKKESRQAKDSMQDRSQSLEEEIHNLKKESQEQILIRDQLLAKHAALQITCENMKCTIRQKEEEVQSLVDKARNPRTNKKSTDCYINKQRINHSHSITTSNPTASEHGLEKEQFDTHNDSLAEHDLQEEHFDKSETNKCTDSHIGSYRINHSSITPISNPNAAEHDLQKEHFVAQNASLAEHDLQKEHFDESKTNKYTDSHIGSYRINHSSITTTSDPKAAERNLQKEHFVAQNASSVEHDLQKEHFDEPKTNKDTDCYIGSHHINYGRITTTLNPTAAEHDLQKEHFDARNASLD